MTPGAQQDHIAKKPLIYALPEMSNVIVRRDHEYARSNSTPLTMDLYYAPGADNGPPPPAVVFVTGFPDAGAQTMFGCRLKDMGSYVSWAQLVALSGLVGITYMNNDPATDVHVVLEYLRTNATELGVDTNRIGVWACSGNAPTALSVLMLRPGSVQCAVLCYSYMLDADNNTHVADAARRFGFANPCAGKSIEDLPRDVPLFIARAGQDRMPGVNETIDHFLGKALALNLPITLVNHSTAPHAFDLYCDDQPSRNVIEQILQFMRSRLGP